MLLGYTYSYLSPDNFGLSQAHVQDDILAPEGPAYRAVVINSTSQLTVSAVDHIRRYAQMGLPVILNGADPGYYLSGNGSDLGAIEEAISKLKQTESVHIVKTGQVAAKLQSLKIHPRIVAHTNGTWFLSWREDAYNQAVYAFVLSDGNSSIGELDVATTRTPYFLDPWTGQKQPVFEYKRHHNRTVIPLRLAANQTVIIEFTDSAEAPRFHATQVPATVLSYEYNQNQSAVLQASAGPASESLTLSNGRNHTHLMPSSIPPTFNLLNWTLTADHWDAPRNMSNAATIALKHNTTYHLPSLVSWIRIAGLVNASGVGYYTTNLTWLPRHGPVDGAYLKFPKIAHAMQLYVNDRRLLPVDYSAPKVDIGPYLREGSNEILAVVPTTMWNKIRSLLGRIENVGSKPKLAMLGSTPGLSENGLVRTVTVVPYLNVRIEP